MNDHYPFELPPLPYPYNGLEPYIDSQTVQVHHDGHLRTYVNNLNEILSDYPRYQNMGLEDLLKNADLLPCEIRREIRNNAGGVYNHILYFEGMSPNGRRFPVGKIAQEIEEVFGSFPDFRQQFTQSALKIFGSGYLWLLSDKNGFLTVLSTKNQDTPLKNGLQPLLTLDVWEHAYYLKHQNKRADYIDDWFYLLDWNRINEQYERFSRYRKRKSL